MSNAKDVETHIYPELHQIPHDNDEIDEIPLKNLQQESNTLNIEVTQDVINYIYPELKERPRLATDIEEIPLNNLKQESNRRDSDRDGLNKIQELKGLLEGDKPENEENQILQISDKDSKGYLDFENYKTMITNVLVIYCRLVVPQPKTSECDELANKKKIVIHSPPLTMIIFSVVESIIFLIDIIYYPSKRHFGECTNGPAASILIYDPDNRYEYWRFVTYMFVHCDEFHLFMNLFIQIFLGVALELVHHWWRVTLVYLAGVLAGSIGASLSNPCRLLDGASGGVYALITAHIATIIMNWNEMEYAIIQFLLLLTYFIFELCRTIFSSIDNSFICHLSGAVAGLLVGLCVLQNFKIHRWERILRWIALISYVTLMMSGIFVHIFAAKYFSQLENNCTMSQNNTMP